MSAEFDGGVYCWQAYDSPALIRQAVDDGSVVVVAQVVTGVVQRWLTRLWRW